MTFSLKVQINLILALVMTSTVVGAVNKAPVKAKTSAKAKASAKKTRGPGSTAAALTSLKLVEGDERGNDLKSLKTELMVARAEQQAVQQAQLLLTKHKGTELEPELHFRLAELYMRRSKTDRFFEVHRESETVVRLAPRVAKEASSRATLTKAAQAYELIQTKFRQFPQMDLVIYNHAFARQTLGQEKESESLYFQLIAKHPSSFLVPDAHLALGEIAFNRAQLNAALDHFNAIRRYPQSRVYPYGLYKAAWTHYNMRDAQLGLKKLEEVVAFGKYVAEKKIDARLDLRKEALNDMTLFFEDVYPSKQAFTYFREQAGEAEVGPILLRMGSLYERHSRFDDQRIVLDKFIAELPASPLLPKVQNDLVLAYDHLRQKDKAVERLAQFNELCQANGSWAKSQKNQDVKKVSADCGQVLNETALRLAKKWLRAWKKLPADTTYADASEKAFEIYLKEPVATEDHRQSRFAYAELLFARQKFRRSSQEYAEVAKTATAPQLAHDAAYAAVLSLEKAVGEKWSNDDEKTFHQLAQSYVLKNPKGQYRLDIEYKMALLAYEKERFEEAAPLFLRLGKEFAQQEKGQKAQDLYLDILNIKKDFARIRSYAQDLMKQNGDPARENKMRKLYEQAFFLQVQTLEEKAQFKEALAEYRAFAKYNPDSELTEKAMWNAMQLHFKLGEAWLGAKAAEEFVLKFPQSPQAVNALLKSAQTFEQMGQLMEAGRVLEQLAIRDAKSALRWKELAADFYALDNGSVHARRLYSEIKTSGDQANRTRLVGKIEALEKNYGTPDAHAAVLKTMIELNMQPQANLAKVSMVEKDFEKGRLTEAFNEARRLLGAGMNANQKARLRLVQAKILQAEFLKASVKSRAERVATVLAIKTEKLTKAQEALQSAIKYGDARVSVEAFERLYSCYAHYVSALKEMPMPTGLNADDAKAFRTEIDNLVVPLEEKSVDTLAQAVKFARQQQFLDGTTARLEAELNKLNHQSNSDLTPALAAPELMLPVLAGVNP